LRPSVIHPPAELTQGPYLIGLVGTGVDQWRLTSDYLLPLFVNGESVSSM